MNPPVTKVVTVKVKEIPGKDRRGIGCRIVSMTKQAVIT